MAWTEPKVNWNENYEPSPEDMNRIEENTSALKNEGMEIDGEKTFKEDATFEKDVQVDGDATVSGNATVSGVASASSVNTGHGDNELYAMDQNVRTSDAPTFDGVTLNGPLNPRTPYDGSWSFTSDNSADPQYWQPSRGVYMYTVYKTGGDDDVEYFQQIYVGAAWRTVAASGCVAITDGSDFRMLVRSDGFDSVSGVVRYLKF